MVSGWIINELPKWIVFVSFACSTELVSEQGVRFVLSPLVTLVPSDVCVHIYCPLYRYYMYMHVGSCATVFVSSSGSGSSL